MTAAIAVFVGSFAVLALLDLLSSRSLTRSGEVHADL
jgi:hypothetical protein